MEITVRAIPYSQMRYPTLGDWQFKGDALEVTVAQQEDWRHEALLAVHEIVEALACKYNGVSETAVDAFDLAHLDAEEPGELPDCPYGAEHADAYAIERVVARILNVNWRAYNKALDKTSAQGTVQKAP
jgi:hypothetical protein